MRSSPPRRAFTLLELLLVLAILALFAGLAAASFGGSERRDVDHSASRLVASLRWCRERAILTGRRHRVVVEADGRSAWVEDETDPLDDPGVFEASPGPWGRREGSFGLIQGETRVRAVGFDLALAAWSEPEEEEPDRSHVTFETTGRTRSARFQLEAGDATAIVRLVGSTGRARVLTVEELAERAQEEEEPAEVWEAQEGEPR